MRKIPFAIALTLFVVTAGSATPGTGEPRNLDKFAHCLANKRVLMYGQFNCPHCKDQEELFGAAFKYVPYVECRVNGKITEQCKTAEIKRTPTWVFPNGERREGVAPLEELSQKSGCPLK